MSDDGRGGTDEFRWDGKNWRDRFNIKNVKHCCIYEGECDRDDCPKYKEKILMGGGLR